MVTPHRRGVLFSLQKMLAASVGGPPQTKNHEFFGSITFNYTRDHNPKREITPAIHRRRPAADRRMPPPPPSPSSDLPRRPHFLAEELPFERGNRKIGDQEVITFPQWYDLLISDLAFGPL